MSRPSFPDPIPVAQARAAVAERIRPGAAHLVLTENALGYTLAQDVRSAHAIPPFPNSAMDGFAVRVADLEALPRTLNVLETVQAGGWPSEVVTSGTCSRIMTGAPLPQGADAIVPVEWTRDDTRTSITITRAPEAGQYVRAAGKDVSEGARVLRAGHVLTPPAVGTLAALGVAQVAVTVPPRVVVLTTGDELVPPGGSLGPGQIYDANSMALAAQVVTAGGHLLDRVHARDTREAVEQALDRAREAEVLVISGGVSVGEYDYVQEMLRADGMEVIFWRVAQRPGKPLLFGVWDGTLVFGLPGNPVSSAMCFEQYVRPTLAALLGRTQTHAPRLPATLQETLTKVPTLHYFMRGIAWMDDERRWRVRSTGAQGSNLYSSVLKANCMVHLPEGPDRLEAGTEVEIEWLPWSLPGTQAATTESVQ